MARSATRDYKPKRGKSGFSGWMGVLLGLAMGLGVAGIVYIRDHRPESIPKTAKAVKKPRGNEPLGAEAADSGAEEPAKSYDFYDMPPLTK